MSYAASAAAQAALYARLISAPGLGDVAIYDALPEAPPGTFVLIGPEEVRDASDQSGAGAEHRLIFSVISDASGFLASKQIAVAIADALADPPYPSLSRGRIVSLSFERARARRLDQGAVRRIDLTFRLRVEL